MNFVPSLYVLNSPALYALLLYYCRQDHSAELDSWSNLSQMSGSRRLPRTKKGEWWR